MVCHEARLRGEPTRNYRFRIYHIFSIICEWPQGFNVPPGGTSIFGECEGVYLRKYDKHDFLQVFQRDKTSFQKNTIENDWMQLIVIMKIEHENQE